MYIHSPRLTELEQVLKAFSLRVHYNETITAQYRLDQFVIYIRECLSGAHGSDDDIVSVSRSAMFLFLPCDYVFAFLRELTVNR